MSRHVLALGPSVDKKIFSAMWNEDDERLFPPKVFGIGWTVNFHAVLRKAGIIDSNKKPRKG